MSKEIKNKEKKYFDIKVEVMLPATITYRVLAEDTEEAVQLVKKANPTSIKHKMSAKKELKLTVYDAGTTIVRFIKNFIGG